MKKKRLGSILLTVVLLVTFLPVHVFAATGDYHNQGNYVARELADGTVRIVTYTGSISGHFDIASTVAGYSVTVIDSGAFNGKGMTSVTVPEGVTAINNSAFANCSSLKSVTLPGTLKTMGNSVFSNCTALETIELPSGFETMGQSIFESCNHLRTVTMGNNVTSIGQTAFHNCTALNSITLSTKLTSIESYAFLDSGLASITIPASVETIGQEAFRGCHLGSVTLNEGLKTIGDNAFYAQPLTQIVIPKSTTSIGAAAFNLCSSLTKAVFLSPTVSIGTGAFDGVPFTDGIYGFAGSTAETLAQTSEIPFQTLFKVTYESNGGSDVDFGYAVSGGAVNKPTDPTKPGSVFVGWYDNEDYVGSVVTFPYTVTENATLYAKWVPAYAVTFESNGGSAVAAQTVGEGFKAVRPEDPTLTGCVFGGWYANSALSDAWDFAADTVTGPTTLYAKWVPICMVTFESNGGSAVTAQTVPVGSKATKPADPTRSGYVFGGWYADSALSNPWDFAVNTVMLPTTTLYAKWTQLTLTASEPSGKIYNGGRIILTPNVPGGTWSYDKSFFTATVNNAATLTALKVGKSTVTYTVGGVSVSYEVTIDQTALPSTGQDFKFVYGIGVLAALAAAAAIIARKRAVRQ